jgi:DNA repair protein RadA/Sms
MSGGMNLKVGLKDFKMGTNILELDVPKQLEETVKTGIGWMDDALGGEGITPSSVALFTGTPGAGKTTAMLQLADSWTKQGNICLMNTSEESLLQVRKVTKRLGLKHGFIAGQDRRVPDVLNHMDTLRKQNPGKKVILILDSLQAHDDGKYKDGGINSMTQCRIAEQITEYCKEHFTMAILVGQVTKDGTFAGKQQIKHTVDIHAHLFIDQKPQSESFGSRIFRVEKNRFGCSGIAYILGLDGKKGLYEKGSYGGSADDS